MIYIGDALCADRWDIIMHCFDVEEERSLAREGLATATDKLGLLDKGSKNLLRTLFHGLEVAQN